MRKRDVTCKSCEETVSRRQSLAVEHGMRACRKHAGTAAAAEEFCVQRRLAREADRKKK